MRLRLIDFYTVDEATKDNCKLCDIEWNCFSINCYHCVCESISSFNLVRLMVAFYEQCVVGMYEIHGNGIVSVFSMNALHVLLLIS